MNTSTIKLSIVYNKINFLSKEIEIEDTINSADYINTIVRKLHDSKDEINLIYVTAKYTSAVFYFNSYSNTNGWYDNYRIEAIETSPNFIDHVVHDVIKMADFKEIDLLEKHPELYEFLPIISEDRAKQFMNFLINTLNINFHPDDDFSDYLREGILTDVNGIDINFDSISIDFMTNQIENCLVVCGDEFYNFGTEILLKHSGIVTDGSNEGTIEPTDIVGRMVHFTLGDNDVHNVMIETCEETGTGDKGKYYRLEWGTEDYLGIYGVDLQKVINGYQVSYENEYDVNVTIGFDELIANIPDDFYQPYFNSLDNDLIFETEIGTITIPNEKVKALFDRAIKPLTITEGITEGYKEYDNIYNIVDGFVSSLFPKLYRQESFSHICYSIVSALIENQLEYQKHRAFVAPEELKTIFSGLLTWYYYLTNTWETSDVDLNEGYPFSDSFDEFSMSEWAETVCGCKIEYDSEPQASIDDLIEAFGSYFEQLGDWIDNFQTHASAEEFYNFNDVFSKNYPFDTSYDDLVPYVRKWVNGVKERYENQFKAEPVVEPVVETPKPLALTSIFQGIKTIMERENSFTLDEESDNELIFSTRENGDSGEEEYSEIDMKEGQRLRRLIRLEYPKEVVSVSLSGVDEWVIMEVSAPE